MDDSEIETIKERLKKTERFSKIWMVVSLVLFALLAGFIIIEKFKPLLVPKEVAARRFLLKGEDRITRGKLEVEDGWANLKLADNQGKTRAILYATDSGTASLHFRDQKGNTRVILGVLTNALPGLYLKDVNRRTRVGFTVLPTTRPVMFLKDEKGENLWHAP